MFGGLQNTHCGNNYNLGSVNGNLKLLIMQHSAPTNFEARQSSRNTWMKFLKVGARNDIKSVIKELEVKGYVNDKEFANKL